MARRAEEEAGAKAAAAAAEERLIAENFDARIDAASAEVDRLQRQARALQQASLRAEWTPSCSFCSCCFCLPPPPCLLP